MMEAMVDQDTCIGCGLCTEMLPEVFEMNDMGKAQVREDHAEVEPDPLREAALSCPVNAIHVEA